jgi:hypothetical protein
MNWSTDESTAVHSIEQKNESSEMYWKPSMIYFEI